MTIKRYPTAIDGPGIIESTPLLIGRQGTRKRKAWIRAMQVQKRRETRLDWAVKGGIALAWCALGWLMRDLVG